MKTLFKFFLAFLIIQSFPAVLAQNESPKFLIYDKDGLKFEYPTDWTLTDKSSPEVQQVYLSKPGKPTLMLLTSPRQFLRTTNQYLSVQKKVYLQYVDAMSKTLSTSDQKAGQEPLCIDFNGRQVSGSKFTGFYNGKASMGEVYPFVLGNRLLTLSYFRTDEDRQTSDEIWKNLIKSMSLEGSNKNAGDMLFESETIDKGVLNGFAIKLVKPTHPGGKPASTVVVVKIVIDEKGKVISAKPIDGDVRFYGVSVIAAEASKFSPTTICNKAMKVTGTIVYNFVPKR